MPVIVDVKTAKTRSEYVLNPRKLLMRIIVWVLCIIFNIFPVALKIFSQITPETFGGTGEFILDIANDLDFLFVGVSAGIVLYMESILAKIPLEKKFKVSKVLNLFCFPFIIAIVIIYTCLFLRPDVISRFFPKGLYLLNLLILLSIGLLGFVYNVLLSIERR